VESIVYQTPVRITVYIHKIGEREFGHRVFIEKKFLMLIFSNMPAQERQRFLRINKHNLYALQSPITQTKIISVKVKSKHAAAKLE